MSRTSPTYMHWFQQTLAHGVLYDETTGELVYLLGTAFLEATQLNQPETLARFGIDSVWFGRYFKRNAQLPTLDGGHRAIERSQLRIKATLAPTTVATDQWQAGFSSYLLEALGFSADQVDDMKLDFGETCCHSPCYGCLDFDLEKAIVQQGNQPFLIAMKAGCGS
jgi:hypothetical protein